MQTFRRICVYGGSSDDVAPHWREAARALGGYLARHRIGVVFGGGRVGLMGALADGALAEGGEVFGVIPEKLRALELDHRGLTELFVVDSMHARKAMMAHLSDAFIAMPGGYGTLEELFEVTTWTQLNYHRKPVGLFNVHGFYDPLIQFLAHVAEVGFIRPMHRGLVVSADEPAALIEAMRTMDIPDLRRWIEKP